MNTFDKIGPGARLRGLGTGIADVVSVSRFGPDALNLVFRLNGRVHERRLYRGEEPELELIEEGRTFGFGAEAALLRRSRPRTGGVGLRVHRQWIQALQRAAGLVDDEDIAEASRRLE